VYFGLYVAVYVFDPVRFPVNPRMSRSSVSVHVILKFEALEIVILPAVEPAVC
jgi:hypothetical protein